MVKNQKGITLIALIITIIVLLLLVVVTVNVVFNGGLFSKTEKSRYQTEVSTIKEQLELEKATRVMDNDGKSLPDYSIIKLENLVGISDKAKQEFKDKIVVNTTGEICYNPENVTDSEEKAWLEEIGIKQYAEAISFYGVAYNAGEGCNGMTRVFFLENNFAIVRDGDDAFVARYIKNENVISMLGMVITLSDDYKVGTMGSDTFEREDNYKYTYNPIKNETYGIYTEAIYTSTDVDTILFVTRDKISYDTDLDDYFLLSEMEFNGVEVSGDGKQITFDGDTYILEEK